MPRNPMKVWQYFAQELVQEEDPQKITYLTQRLFEALAESDETVESALSSWGSAAKTNHPR
jgi:hypothetical protein